MHHLCIHQKLVQITFSLTNERLWVLFLLGAQIFIPFLFIYYVISTSFIDLIGQYTLGFNETSGKKSP